ncbi:MAG: CPBP family intramembrane metalloprotease [Alistipes sp.]|nr:CPBP family intramembrane metalloprotease [Alistipes sp.]
MNNVAKIRTFPSVGDVAMMLLLFCVTQLVVGLLLRVVGIVAPVTSAIDAVDVETYMGEQLALGRYTAMAYPLLMLSSIAVLWIYARLRGGKRVIRIRHSASGLNPTVVLVGVLWLFSSQIILEPLVELLPENPGQGLGRGAWACFTAVVTAAISEELLCRGLLFEVLNKRWGVKSSIFFSALFFGLIHFDPATAVIALVAGMIFGVLYVRTSSLYTTIIIHAINNALAFALISFGVGDISFEEVVGGGVLYYILYGVAVAIFVACSVEAYFKVFKKKKQISE